MRRYIAPLLLIALAILSGLLAAILARAFLVQITKGFIGVLEGITPSPQLHLLPNSWRGALVEIQPIDPKAIGFDYGVGAFGAAFLFTKMEELVDSASTLIKQRTTATTSVFWSAFMGLALGFGAVGLSVYGLKALGIPPSSSTFVFDALTTPASQVDRHTGYLTFYVSFLDEGRQPTFASTGHGSVTVTPGDKVFLRHLAEALNACGAAERPVRLTLRGFASGSLWTTAETEVSQMLSRRGIARGALGSCDPNSTDEGNAPRNAVACIDKYKKAQVGAVDGPGYLSDETTEAAKAFNVYLANRRLAAVAQALGVQEDTRAKVRLDGEPWLSYSQMEAAIAVDDTRANGTFAVKGILTRSVAITITQPAGCSNFQQ